MCLLNYRILLLSILTSPLSGQPNLENDPDFSQNPFQSQLEEKQVEIENILEEGQNAINDAKKLLKLGNIKDTEDILSDIEKNLPQTVLAEDLFNQVQYLRAEIILIQAEEAYQNGRIGEAKVIFNEYNTLKKFESRKQQRFSNRLEKNLRDPYKQNLGEINPKYVKNLAKSKELILEGEAQFINGDYLGAFQTFKDALLEDPLNSTAKGYLTIIDDKLAELGRKDYDNTRSQLLRNVTENWQLPRVFDRKMRKNPTSVTENPIAKKLAQIRIEEIHYSSRPLSGVVEDLSDISVLYDKTNIGSAGVNIVLMEPNHDPLITIKLRNQTLKDVLDVITSYGQCDYELDEEIIKITKRGGSNANTSSNLKREVFPITKAAIGEITGSGSNSLVAPAEADIFAAEPVPVVANNPASDEESAIKSFFERAGVPFGNNGSSLALTGTKLFVTQTTRNLEKIRNILRNFDQTRQVRIHSKFLEVRQGDLDDMGIRWNATSGDNDFFDTTSNLRTLDNMSSIPTGNTGAILRTQTSTEITERIENGFLLTDSTTTIEPLDPVIVENSFPTLSDTIDRGVDALPVLGLLRGIGDWDVLAKLRALERKRGSDLMSAPSVTVLSGKTAEVVIGQEFRYPTAYTDAEASVNGGNNSGSSIAITPGTPMDFETRTIGVEMNVTPTVEEDGQTINLKLTPQVTQFEGFVEYGGQIVGVGSNAQMTIPSNYIQPIFSTRRVSTEVSIFDGAVVVLGGLTRNDVMRIHDKVPFFGSIPILGKAFQSKGETNQKRNLLIFVGANLISPGGSTSKERFNTVEPNSLFRDPMIMTPGGSVARSLKE